MYNSGQILGASTGILLPAAVGYISGIEFFYILAGITLGLIGLNIVAKGVKKLI